jgi:dihydroneopterin aldolase
LETDENNWQFQILIKISVSLNEAIESEDHTDLLLHAGVMQKIIRMAGQKKWALPLRERKLRRQFFLDRMN